MHGRASRSIPLLILDWTNELRSPSTKEAYSGITLPLYMASGEVIVKARLLKWGNSYGIRLKKADLKKAGLAPGAEAVVRLSRRKGRVDLSALPTFSGGRPDDSFRHDDLLGRARRRALRERTR